MNTRRTNPFLPLLLLATLTVPTMLAGYFLTKLLLEVVL